MKIVAAIPQLRTTDLDSTLAFYRDRLGFEVAFRYSDFYAGVRIGSSEIHLKLVDDRDPSIPYVRSGDHLHLFILVDGCLDYAREVVARGVTLLSGPSDTDYSRNEFVIEDDQGHRLYFAESDAGDPAS